MKVKTIGADDIFLNKLTKYGRKRNQVIERMAANGCQIIREYREGCNSRVYLGYINPYVSLAEYAARVYRNGTLEEKHTKAAYSPLPSSKKTFYLKKVKTDKDGNTNFLKRIFEIKNGKVVLLDEEEGTVRKHS